MILARALLTGGGLGHLRPAPGTWGSLPPPLAVMLGLLWLGPGWWIDAGLAAGIVVFSWACVGFGTYGESRYGRKDPRQIVADEVAGQCVALLALPWRAMADAASFGWNAALAGAAFLAFRIADITKPPPANGLQRLSGGWGILIDDLIAGAYALIVVQLLARLLLVRLMAAG
ncbi:MAG: phosphatidylglycerophosphatase A family protein [Planctomycetota bacterium]|jgi:phosphatidylglycerophosphatase A